MKLPHARNVLLGIGLAVLLLSAALMIAQDQETLHVRTSLAATDPHFPEYLSRLVGHRLTAGDSYVVYSDGPSAFDAMLRAIDGAKRRVSFETYIFAPGEVGERFIRALEAAARRGVEVRLILDAVGGSAIEDDALARLQSAGCRIGTFNSVGFFGWEEANYRTHRKALVVDGDLAFVGGIGIADQWLRSIDGLPRWRDTHVEVRGAAAINIEAAFSENWIETGGVVEPDLLPRDNAPAGPAQSIVVWSSPEGGTNAMKLLYLLAIAAARRTIDIQSPYVITDETTLWSLLEARKRGVRIRMLTEGEITDAKPVKFAGRAAYQTFLDAGIDVYEYQPAMMHAKAIVIDGAVSIIGSANFDNRSFELNDELNVVVFDTTLAQRLSKDFDADLRNSRKLDAEGWRSRPPHIRGREKLWSLFGEVF